MLDDLQYAHGESLDLLAYLIDHLRAPVLVLALARPDMLARRDDEWLGHGGARHSAIQLSPLTEHGSQAVAPDIARSCGDDPAVEDLVHAACAVAGGNPALLERMVQVFHDIGVLEDVDLLGEDDHWRVHADKLAKAVLPLTVEDAVKARIAALSADERSLLEQAAVMGSVFWLGGLVAMGRIGSAVPERWLDPEHVDQQRDSRSARHAHRARLRARAPRQQLPRRGGVRLQAQPRARGAPRAHAARPGAPAPPRRGDVAPLSPAVHSNEELLCMMARHCEGAKQRARAALAFLEAGDVARGRYANGKAAECYKRCLELLAGETDEAGVDVDHHLRALHHYGDMLQDLGRNDEALGAFRKMLDLAFRFNLKGKGGAAHHRIGRLFRETGNLVDATSHFEAAHALFVAAGDERGIASTVNKNQQTPLAPWRLREGARGHAAGADDAAPRLGETAGQSRSASTTSGSSTRTLGSSSSRSTRSSRRCGSGARSAISSASASPSTTSVRSLRISATTRARSSSSGRRTRSPVRPGTARASPSCSPTWARRTTGQSEKALERLHEAQEMCDDLGDKLGLADPAAASRRPTWRGASTRRRASASVGP